MEVLDLESAALQQVLGLESKQLAPREGMNEPLLATIRVRHIVDELDLLDLSESVVAHNFVTPHHPSPVRR